MNNTNETYNNTIPYIFNNNDSNVINSYGGLFLCFFVFVINMVLSIFHKSNLNKIIHNIINEKESIIKLNNLILQYIKNDNIIQKKNEIIKRRNSNKEIIKEEDINLIINENKD